MGRGPSPAKPAGIPHWGILGILGIRGVCGRLTALSLRPACLPHRPRSSQGVWRDGGEKSGDGSGGVEELEKAKRHCSPGDWTPGEVLTRTGTRHSVHGVQHLIEPGPPSCEGSRRTDQRRPGSSSAGRSSSQVEATRYASRCERGQRLEGSGRSLGTGVVVWRWGRDEGGEPPTRGLLRKNR